MHREQDCIYGITKLVPFLILIAISAIGPAYADADQDLRTAIETKMQTAWDSEQFAVLEQMAEEFINPDKRTVSGKRLLAVYESKLDGMLYYIPPKRTPGNQLSEEQLKKLEDDEKRRGPDPSQYEALNKEWDKIEAKLKRWERQFPKSPTPQIAMAEYFMNRGYRFRGSGLAKEVRPEAWPILRRNFEAAADVLISSPDISRRNPMWFSAMLSIAGILDMPPEGVRALIDDTLKNGQGYSNALQAAFQFMQPKWGGSVQEMESYAVEADLRSFPEEKGQTYARLYWNLYANELRDFSGGFFRRTLVNRERLWKSFEVIIRLYPEPRNFTGYAMFACEAGDMSKVRAMIAKAGTLEYYQRWPEKLRNACPIW